MQRGAFRPFRYQRLVIAGLGIRIGAADDQ
jgi:hypothetical protein